MKRKGVSVVQNILMSKLIPPDPPIYYMRRSKLSKKLSSSMHAKLTVVHSGAGYGKTSALAQLMADQKFPFSWYQVTEEDDDLLPFLRHLFFSIQRVCPQFGKSMVGWDRFSMFPQMEELNQLYVLFINEFCKLKEPLFVIIDDFHLVHHVFQINYILDKIIEHLPSHIHFLVASRIYPSWNCIFQLRMNGKLVECKEDDFIFSNEEVQVLFEDYFGRYLTIEENESILSVTEGWAIAILLLALQSNDSTLPINEITDLSLQDFFSYLSEEVFDNLNTIQQETLLKCSIFQTFSMNLIENFYNDQLADELKNLVKHYAFIQPLIGHKEFRFHALFHQFLQLKMLEKNEEEYYSLHKQAANYFVQEDNPINALYHSFKTNDETLIAEILVRFADYFIRAGQFDYFIERLRELTKQSKESFYALYFYEGECQRYRAQYEKAKKAYQKCLTISTLQHDTCYMLKANAGIAHIYLDTIQPALAQKFLTKALELVEHVDIKKDDLYLLQRQYAENLVNLGRAGEAEKWVELKGIPNEILMKGNLDVRILLRQGKLLEAKRLILSRKGYETLSLDAHRESDVLLALILTLMGENEEAFERSSTSLKHSIRDHTKYSEAVASLRKGHAILQLNPFDFKEAELCYLKTIELMDSMHVTRAKAESYMGLAIVKARQGYVDEAISYANLGLYETERVQDRWVSGLLLTALTMIYLENDNFDDAVECVTKANNLFKISPDVYGEMLTYFWLSYITFKKNNKEEFLVAFRSFASICDEQNYSFFLNKRTLFGPRNLLVIVELVHYSLSLLPNEQIFKKLQHQLEVEKENIVPKHSFTIQLFGPFTMYRNGIEIEDKEWKREKAKELFLYLYINRNRFIAKEEIMNILWPNSDEETMVRDFKVVYNACLKVLEPNRTAREESAYINRKQSMYQLYQSKAFTSDIEYFKQFSEKGLEEKDPNIAIEWLMKAVSLYKGNVLEESPDLVWIGRLREEMFRLYILDIERIAQNHIRLKKFQDVIFWAQKLIQLDETWEEGYRLLMLGYYHINNRPQAVKWYEKCVEILAEELEIEPMETTIQIYEMITR